MKKSVKACKHVISSRNDMFTEKFTENTSRFEYKRRIKRKNWAQDCP